MRVADLGGTRINLPQFLVSFCLILIFAGGVVFFIQRNEQPIEEVAIEQLRGNFLLAVANIRMLSQQQGHCQYVTYQQRKVVLNQRGKPAQTTPDGVLMCDEIWQQVMGRDVQQAGVVISAIPIAAKARAEATMLQGCRYRAGNVILLDYYP